MRGGIYSNMYQGDAKRVVTVCSANMLRSPTMAEILSRSPFNFNTRSCGTESYALIPFTEELAIWADEIVCADTEHAISIRNRLMTYQIDKPIVCLKIPDIYEFRHPELIKLIKERYKEATNTDHETT